MGFEYRVVPAPTRGKKVKGVKTAADRFAHALAEVMNEQAADGWEYLRTDTLPAEERQGLTGRTTVFQNMLVFRRPAEAEAETIAEAPGDSDSAEAVNIFTETDGPSKAPKLPSATAAQAAANAPDTPNVKAEKRNVAAE